MGTVASKNVLFPWIFKIMLLQNKGNCNQYPLVRKISAVVVITLLILKDLQLIWENWCQEKVPPEKSPQWGVRVRIRIRLGIGLGLGLGFGGIFS